MASSVVHPLPPDDEGGEDRITPPRPDPVLASSSSHVWPSVSDSDEGEEEKIRYPTVEQEEEDGEVLDMVEGEITEEKVEDHVLQELGDVLTQEETEVLRERLAAVEAEESSSGSVVNPGDDDWLRVDKVEEVPDSGLKPRVYTFPEEKKEEEREREREKEDAGSQLLASPVGIAIELVGFQMKLIMQMISITLWLCSFGVSVMTFPFRFALTATNAAVDGYTLATQVKPMVEQGAAQAGPVLRQTAKRCGFGCVAAVYVMFMLGALLVPALFLNMWFARGFIEDPAEFRDVLHFDYRQERPSATMVLLPPAVLAKVKGGVYPNKVLQARAIPLSHKLQVTVFLTLPESHYNRDLGMFQVSAELLSVRGQILKRASWPCMLRFQSSSIRYAKQVILGVPLLMGLSGESQKVSLRLFENEEEGKIPTAMVRILLEPKAGYPVGQGLPEIYSAEAQVLSVLPWTKDILRRWKWTFYVWSFLSVFMFEVMLVLCCCHQMLLPSSLLQGITEGFRDSEPATPAKRVGKHGRRVNFSDELPTARPVRVPDEREALLGTSEPSSTTTRPRLRRLPTPAYIPVDSSDNSSFWSIPPPLEPLDYVGGRVQAAGGSMKRLGKTVVDGAAEGVEDAVAKVAPVLDPKSLKSD